MTDPLRPPAAPADRRLGDRRQSLRRAKAPNDGRDLVPTEPAADPRAAARPQPENPADFSAQVLGQQGVKRGLRGGQEVLDRARSTYLGAEFSGGADRRPRPGGAKKTEV